MQLPVRQKIGQTALEVDKIRRDGGTQPRVKIDQDLAREYGEAMQEEGIAAFDPVIVFWDGTDFWLADGFHRVIGARLVGLAYVRVDVREGTRRDAILYSVGANARPGIQRRSNEDKRRSVMTLLNDQEWGKWSDNEIARRCAVSQNFVSEMHRSLKSDLSETRTYTTKHGTVAQMNTANIGHSPSAAIRQTSSADKNHRDGRDRATPRKGEHQPPAAAPSTPPTQPSIAQPRGNLFAPAAVASTGAAHAFHPGSSSVPLSGPAVRPADSSNGYTPKPPATALGSPVGHKPVINNGRSQALPDQSPISDMSLSDLLNRYDAETRQHAENDAPDTSEALRAQRQEMAQLIAALRAELVTRDSLAAAK